MVHFEAKYMSFYHFSSITTLLISSLTTGPQKLVYQWNFQPYLPPVANLYSFKRIWSVNISYFSKIFPFSPLNLLPTKVKLRKLHILFSKNNLFLPQRILKNLRCLFVCVNRSEKFIGGLSFLIIWFDNGMCNWK